MLFYHVVAWVLSRFQGVQGSVEEKVLRDQRLAAGELRALKCELHWKKKLETKSLGHDVSMPCGHAFKDFEVVSRVVLVKVNDLFVSGRFSAFG